MSCGNRYKNARYKSAQMAYNNDTQAFVAGGTGINILGVLGTDTGCSLDTMTGGFVVNSSGLYRFSFDITATATDAGTLTLHAYSNETPLPCAVSRTTVTANGTASLHAETILRISTCAVLQPLINIRVGGVAGNVTHVCASAVKLA